MNAPVQGGDGRPPGEGPAQRAFLDKVATETLAALGSAGFFGGRHGCFPASDYHALAQRVCASFEVPDTAITTIAARLFYGISMSLAPACTVGLGTYYANGLVWLCGHQFGGGGEPAQVVACDIDPEATAGARRNFAALCGGAAQPEYSSDDAVSLLRATASPIDLLYIDIDAPDGDRKAGYTPILQAALPRLRPGALVIAHDRCVARFAGDFARYMEFVNGSGEFRASVTLPIDSYGLELTLR